VTVAGPWLLLLALVFTAGAVSSGKGEPMSGRTIEEVLKAHTAELMSLPGVVGTAQGLCTNRPCIKVYVGKKAVGPEQKIPAMIEGYPVEIEATGMFRTLPDRE
jgi:hypothetical protein